MSDTIETVTVQARRLPPWWLVIGLASLAVGAYLALKR
jgi:hypothetical protein